MGDIHIHVLIKTVEGKTLKVYTAVGPQPQ